MHILSRRTPWLLLLCALGASAALAAARRPNILWITCEDTGPQLGCYGDTYAETPNLDRFAERSLRYRHVWSTAPVCAPARTAIISGAYPSRFGAEHMRSDVPMPPGTRMFPQFLRDAGYYCANNVKEDYNLIKPGQVWDDSSTRAHWRNRAPGQPFFAVVNFTTTHESQIRARPHELKHDPAKAPLPAYHPDTPEVRRDWAQYYDKVTEMDAQAGRVLRELEADGLANETIVFFYGDHGPGMPRGKRWPYNSGLQVPLIVHVPEAFRHLAPNEYSPGGWSDRLVGFVDLAPTVLSLAGVSPPAWMDGRAFMGPHAGPPARYLFGERGRMDERPDLVRSVRNERFVYVRQYQPHLPYGQHVSYMFLMPTARVWKQLYDEGKLSAPQTYFWEPKPAEELYDLATDPDEVRNLVNSPEHRAVLNELRAALRRHLQETRDLGFLPEGERARLAPGQSPTRIPETRSGYPMKRALAMADAASLGRPAALAKLQRGLRAQSSAERYWAAQGILMRGAPAIAASRNELRLALTDEAPSVRIVAAQALAQHGTEADREAALATLKSLVSPAVNGHAVAVEALNAVDALGAVAAPLHDFLRSMDRKAPGASSRIEEHVPRLLAHILGEPR
ncbi:MAG: sulfatase-like hydrolase/transferase, partial [Verrucomicrobia bacterium]|nr:sulfatase-like hydrolase/transferase [Verrucomicrobiota bacterium]